MKDVLTVALPKGRIQHDTMKLLEGIGISCEEMKKESRKLIFQLPEAKMRFMVVRASDVPTYVEYGAADMGVVGKDVLMEQGKNIYEPLDLKIGYCRMVVAEPKVLSEQDNPSEWTHVRIATKFPNITEDYFRKKGVQVELIKLYGSIELAPLVGLSERIVDLVSSGETLKQNGLVEVEQIMEVTSRLIVNRASLKTRYERINSLVDRLKSQLDKEGAR
ncbi:MAG: ATP phosphoribosyltransferase [Deltaproteobacteria bacterium]|nr:ATP phosphoribosyltransferase [Deltaproteobacteria bacterium]